MAWDVEALHGQYPETLLTRMLFIEINGSHSG